MPYASREKYLDYQRRYDRSRPPRDRKPDKKRWRARRRQEAQRPKVPPGTSRALDMLRDQLRRHDRPGPEHDRLAAAVAHMERVILGGRGIKPREPDRPSRASPRVPRHRAAAVIEAADPTRATSRAVGSWMDRRLGPESA